MEAILETDSSQSVLAPAKDNEKELIVDYMLIFIFKDFLYYSSVSLFLKINSLYRTDRGICFVSFLQF